MRYLPTLSSSCRPLWQTLPLSEMGKSKIPSLLFVESVESEYTDLHPHFSFHSLVIDVTMALDTLSLPVLEPLTPGRLLDVTVLALSCLYAGGFIEKFPLVEFRCTQRTSGVFFFSLRCECGNLHGHTAGGQWLAASCSLHWLQGGRLWKWRCYHCAEMRRCH